MKKIIIISAMLATLVVSSCKKDLSEVPLDFYTPENSFNNKAQFESAWLVFIWPSEQICMHQRMQPAIMICLVWTWTG
jgi:hypothetical protein